MLTAAHCVSVRDPAQRISKVRLGAWHIHGYGAAKKNGTLPEDQDFDINEENIIIHENYKNAVFENGKKNYSYDIALIRLPKLAILNQLVQVACLPDNFEQFNEEQEIDDEIEGIIGRKPTVVGWGKTDAYQLKSWDGVGSKIQQKLEVF